MNQIVLTPRTSLGLFLGSLFLLLIMMSYQITDPGTSRSVLVTVVLRLFSPFQIAVWEATHSVAGGVENYFFLVNTNKENARLKRELSEMKIRLQSSGQQKEENDRLRRILQLREQAPYQLIIGEVVGRDAKFPVSNTVIANRGKREGIHMEMPVITPQGIVGMTVVVSSISSKIQLITDVSSSIGAMLQQSRTAGILSGLGSGNCILRYLPLTTAFKKGDMVLTSGQDKIFPEGLPIGRINQPVYESEYYKSAEVIPLENFSLLNEVVFLAQEPASAPDSLQPSPGGESAQKK